MVKKKAKENISQERKEKKTGEIRGEKKDKMERREEEKISEERKGE